MNVLFAASECAPFIKTGGLADVVAALPKALAAKGLSVRVLLPAYPSLAPMVQAGKTVARYEHLPGGAANIVAHSAEGLDLLLLDAPHLFARPGNPYVDGNGHDYGDNHIRFGALSKAAGLIAQQGLGDWTPDILHAHDWQAGLAPVYMRLGEGTVAKAVT
ncbi:MAG: glycogen/starch synthase, partial [Pseudomonadota bacterium]